jgi:hypothetical protein
MRSVAYVSWALLCSLAGGLAACSTPAELSDRAIDFNKAIAEAGDNQLLLNIVRAAYRNPTRYSAISKLSESRATDASIQIGGQIPIGPDAAGVYNINPTGSLRHNRQPVMDVAPLDDRKFALGLLGPIEPKTFTTYWRQNWPRSILLFLLVDDVVLNDAARDACGLPVRRIDNAAYDADQFELMRKFVKCVRRAVSLTEEPSTQKYIENAVIPPTEVLKKLPELVKDNFSVAESSNTKGQRTYTVSRSRTQWKFELQFGRRKGVAMATTDAEPIHPRESDVPSVVFTMRSVDGMIYYLGELLRLQIDHGFEPLVPWGYKDEQRILFRVDIGAGPRIGDKIEAELLGQRFSVPRTPRDDELSLTVLSLLSQIFALYRESSELPKTTTVQLLGIQ